MGLLGLNKGNRKNNRKSDIILDNLLQLIGYSIFLTKINVPKKKKR